MCLPDASALRSGAEGTDIALHKNEDIMPSFEHSRFVHNSEKQGIACDCGFLKGIGFSNYTRKFSPRFLC
jgi:hypothetical protein